MSTTRAEFQVVILAGGEGNRLHPLTEDIPKPMLPIANQPMIYYQLTLLELAGFSRAIVVTIHRFYDQINQYVHDNFNRDGFQVDIHQVEEQLGTADVLRAIKDRLTSDFMVVSGDLVTEVCLQEIADVHRIRSSTVTMLLKEEERPDPDQKRKRSQREDEDMDYIGLVEGEEQRVVFFVPAVCVDQQLSLPKQLLMRKPNLTIHTNLLDAQLYIFSHWVLELLVDRPHLSCIKTDLVPLLVRKQFSNAKSVVPARVAEQAVVPQQAALAMSSSPGEYSASELIRVYAVRLPADGPYTARANSLAAYSQINKEVATRPVSLLTPWKDASRSQVDAGGRKHKDCVIGDGTTTEDKVSLKMSVIGSNCSIGARAKLNNCIVMDNVTIGDSCIIQNSVICQHVVIAPSTNLNDCQVNPGVSVAAGTFKGEAVMMGQ